MLTWLPFVLASHWVIMNRGLVRQSYATDGVLMMDCAATERRKVSSYSEGLVVLDLSKTLAGPFCTMNMGDMGAEVIKVEEPTSGDETRQWWRPYWDGQACFYLAVNRNKRNIAVNLKHPHGVEVVKKLAATADVMIESFRTGTADKMGLGYEAIKDLNPRIVYCAISGFGRTGPLRHKGGYDLMVQAYSGLMSTTGEPGRTPLRIGFSLVDIHLRLGGIWRHHDSAVPTRENRPRTVCGSLHCSRAWSRPPAIISSITWRRATCPVRWGKAIRPWHRIKCFPPKTGG